MELSEKNSKWKYTKKYVKRYWQLYLLLLLPVLYFFTFKYAPMYGIVIAFKDYNIFAGISGSPWVGLDVFRDVFSSNEFFIALRNTLLLNLGDLAVSFPFPIIIAIFLNELISTKVKRTTQTILYIPYFLSWVIISGMVYQIFGTTGIANQMLAAIGGHTVNFLSQNTSWVIVYLLTGVWQSAGYSTIIYLAALTSIDPSLYEAAYVDGATRWKRIWYITLPSIKGTISILLILQLGKIINISFDRPFMLGNVIVKNVSQVISTYVYNVGLQSGRFDFATAVGLFQSVVGLVMLLTVNYIAKKMGEEGVM